ncbi:MAG: hypothetical protein HDQ93_03060 [Desulfovibrio sp.]|nr:hypothetical protein [Desulfovibrio sp.]
MKKITQSERVSKFLKDNSGIKYDAREIAQNLIELFPDIYEDKGKKSGKFGKELEDQVRNEIDSKRDKLKKFDISWDNYPKPRKYYYSKYPESNEATTSENDISSALNLENNNSESLNERELYEPFIDFLKNSYNLSSCFHKDWLLQSF